MKRGGGRNLNHFLAVLLVAVLMLNLCACGVSPSGSERDKAAELTTGSGNSTGPGAAGGKDSLTYLGHELEKSADHLMKNGEDVDDIYSELHWSSVADTFPARFDLRERGTITPVKSQDPWGTCWSFATAAASETSILNSLGMTVESYREKYGEDLDLSERHLAWFTTKALPEVNEYPSGEYPYDETQAGEGLHLLEGMDVEPLNAGGNYFLSATSLAAGIGILKEKYAPYSNNEGTLEKTGDWSLPEKDRYAVSFELKEANILPSPASDDGQGNYMYRPEATEAVKTELLAGRAVGFSFYADQSMPEQSKEEKKKTLEENLKDETSISDKEKALYIDVRAGIKDTADLSSDELRDLILLRLRINDMPEDTYDLAGFEHDQLAEIFLTNMFGSSYDDIVAYDNQKQYMSFIGSDPVIYAQYTYEKLKANHGVTVVGWDDSFSAKNWPKDRRPPADGAWIVKNSWGTEWGDDGYFMLSYYDKSLCSLGSFEYVVSDDSQSMDYLNILEYDNMPAEIISSTLFDSAVYTANVFTVDEECVLEYVSAMTGDMDTAVTASIYLLDKDAAGPTDGALLDTITETFRFAGYHRLALSDKYLLPKGSRFSVVIMEKVPVEKDSKYALVNNSSLNEKGAKAYNELNKEKDRPVMRYAKGVVNPGESYVSFDSGKWMDWTEAISGFENMGSNANMAYDNLPIKAYLYPWSKVKEIHDLSESIQTLGGKAAVCPEDGYTLIDARGE